jgi:hypothetical protein
MFADFLFAFSLVLGGWRDVHVWFYGPKIQNPTDCTLCGSQRKPDSIVHSTKIGPLILQRSSRRGRCRGGNVWSPDRVKGHDLRRYSEPRKFAPGGGAKRRRRDDEKVSFFLVLSCTGLLFATCKATKVLGVCASGHSGWHTEEEESASGDPALPSKCILLDPRVQNHFCFASPLTTSSLCLLQQICAEESRRNEGYFPSICSRYGRKAGTQIDGFRQEASE